MSNEDSSAFLFLLIIILTIAAVLVGSVAMLTSPKSLELGEFGIPEAPVGERYVQDFAEVLSPEEKTELSAYSAKLKEETGVEVIIVTHELTDPRDINDISELIGSKWSVDGFVLALGMPGFSATWSPVFHIADSANAPKAVNFYRTRDYKVKPVLAEKRWGEALMSGVVSIGDQVRMEKGLPTSGDPNPTGWVEPDMTSTWWIIGIVCGILLLLGAVVLCVAIKDWVRRNHITWRDVGKMLLMVAAVIVTLGVFGVISLKMGFIIYCIAWFTFFAVIFVVFARRSAKE